MCKQIISLTQNLGLTIVRNYNLCPKDSVTNPHDSHFELLGTLSSPGGVYNLNLVFRILLQNKNLFDHSLTDCEIDLINTSSSSSLLFFNFSLVRTRSVMKHVEIMNQNRFLNNKLKLGHVFKKKNKIDCADLDSVTSI